MPQVSLSQVLASLVLASIVLSGCSDSGTSDNDQRKSTQTEEQNPNDTGINVLTSFFPSPKEQNPYSVENMNKTFKNFILANNANAKDIPELEANFLYVRFLPYGKKGVYELKTYDTSLALFKHPMDYNKIRKPVAYVDNSLPDSIIPYFASVPVGYEFGPTPYEILQELFLTQPLEEDEEDYQEGSYFVKAKKSNEANKAVAAYLESQGLVPSQLEAAAIPNSERLNPEIESNSKGIVAWSLFPSRWRPSGTLTFTDSLLGKWPLVKVRVTAGYSFYWRSSTTNDEGKFESPERWRYSVDYEANFDSYQFLLQDGHSWYGEDLEIEKNNKRSAWVETFTGNHAKWCVIWMAAWNYWYGYTYGLKRPRQNEWWNQSLEINVYYKNDKDYYGRYTIGTFVERINVLAHGRTHLEMYGTTIHEIAHSSHYWNMETRDWKKPQSSEYIDLPSILKETYARGVQRYLSIKHYGNWSMAFYDSVYTGLFEDLEDTVVTFAARETFCDKVSGITAPMAEKALFKSSSWNNLKENLIKDYPNGTLNDEGGIVSYTQADMDALFDYWKTGEETPCSVPSSSSEIPSSSSKDPRDEYVYKTVQIGEQYWLAENLIYDAPGSRCYNDDPANCEIYGKLYDWATAMNLPDSCNTISCSEQINTPHQGICPTGWHIPTLAEWNKLILFANGKDGPDADYDDPWPLLNNVKLIAKSPLWTVYFNGTGTDDFGFSALPGGMLEESRYSYIGGICFFWGATEGGSRYESTYPDDSYNNFAVFKRSYASGGYGTRKINALSVRCIKD